MEAMHSLLRLAAYVEDRVEDFVKPLCNDSSSLSVSLNIGLHCHLLTRLTSRRGLGQMTGSYLVRLYSYAQGRGGVARTTFFVKQRRTQNSSSTDVTK